MKAIRIFQDSKGNRPHIRLYADSAIGRDVMPLFIPDLPGDWIVRICVAVRVHRLGKNISPKFAMRYVDALSAVALLLPVTDASAWDECGVLAVLDSAVTTGSWYECNIAAITSIDFDTGVEIRTFNSNELDIASAVSEVSRYATLRTGDVLILDFTGIDMPLTRDSHIHTAIDHFQCLSLKVK